MCVVVPLENGTYQGYCLGCAWITTPKKSKRAAETLAGRHNCRKRGDK
jgi:hypothetical protein